MSSGQLGSPLQLSGGPEEVRPGHEPVQCWASGDTQAQFRMGASQWEGAEACQITAQAGETPPLLCPELIAIGANTGQYAGLAAGRNACPALAQLGLSETVDPQNAAMVKGSRCPDRGRGHAQGLRSHPGGLAGRAGSSWKMRHLGERDQRLNGRRERVRLRGQVYRAVAMEQRR